MSPQAAWILESQIAPKLTSSVRHHVRPVPPEDHDEVAQDAIAMAAQMLHRAEQNGKQVSAGNIVYYTLKMARSGRRSAGFSKTDALGTATQMYGRSSTVSMDESFFPGAEGEEGTSLYDLLSTDREDPVMAGARRLDWEEFLAGLSELEIGMLVCLAEGREMQGLARALRVSSSKLSGDKGRLANRIKEFFGSDVLQAIAVEPGWKCQMRAQRERTACRRISEATAGK